MHRSKSRKTMSVLSLLAIALALMCISVPAEAGDSAAGGALVQDYDNDDAAVDPLADAEPVEFDDDDVGMEKPVDIFIKYAITTDYIWRGINYTDYPKEDSGGRPSHEITAGLELNCPRKEFGKVGMSVFAQFYSGMRAANAGRSDHLGAVDYTLYWKNTIDDVTAELGWTLHTWPRVSGDADDTNELFVKLTYDDKDLYGAESGVFNPYVFYAVDLDTVKGGGWFELGVDHAFDLDEYTNGLRYLTITPSMSLGIDNRYLHAFSAQTAIPAVSQREAGQKATRLANIVYGLAFDYDLSDALQMDPGLGNLSLGAFVKYSDALREDILNDQFWGGLQVAYKW